MMIILYSLSTALSEAVFIKFLTFSTPLFEAASISIELPTPLFIALANALAVVVFPQPDEPQNKYVFLNSFKSNCLFKILIIES